MSFVTQPADIDELRLADEPPRDYVLRMATAKAQTVWDRLISPGNEGLDTAVPVLGADTIVMLNNRVFLKPVGRADAIAMLMALSGRRHKVLSAVAVCGDRGTHTGEPADKAGAYAIQGLGAVFVKSIQGSYSGVVGLPIAETMGLLEVYGICGWHSH
jgi:septum formation protein